MDAQTIVSGPRHNPDSASASQGVLVTVAGPARQPALLRTDRPTVIGRDKGVDVELGEDRSVSRKHAVIECKRGRWFITHLGSQLPSTLNATPLERGRVTPLNHGDVIGIGLWWFRIQLGGQVSEAERGSALGPEEAGQVSTVKVESLLAQAERQLGQVLDLASAMQRAADEKSLSSAVVRAVATGTGFSRAAAVRLLPGGDSIVFLAALANNLERPDGVPISRSLGRAAASGEVSQLSGDSALRQAHSIVQQGIRSALCAPITVGGQIVAFLYADHSENVGSRGHEAASFLAAVAHLYGLALGDLRRRATEERYRELAADLSAARHAQERLMPPLRARVGQVHYALESIPGRLVAGDLFDVVDLSNGRVAFFLGDVMGKGMGAAVLMASAQTHLRTLLCRERDLSVVMGELNREISLRSESGEFITLFLGVVDTNASTLEYVDCGHSCWMIARSGGGIERMPYAEHLALGIMEDEKFNPRSIPLKTNDRVVVFSDGVREQCNPEGAEFDFSGTAAALEASRDEAGDVEEILRRLKAFAQTDSLADDVTIASVRLAPAGA